MTTSQQDRHHRHSASQPPEVTCGHPSHQIAGPPAPTHTPGPWRAHDDDGTGTLPCVLSDKVNAGGNFYVAHCNVFADARLIAAAPEMLALLREMHDAAQSVPILKEPGWTVSDVADALPMMKALEKSRALLAKIDGR